MAMIEMQLTKDCTEVDCPGQIPFDHIEQSRCDAHGETTDEA
jgi:hypothetical protein